MSTALLCDVCGSEIVDYEHGMYHFSGVLNGELSTHIHVCNSCFDNTNETFFGIDVTDGKITPIPIKRKTLQFTSANKSSGIDILTQEEVNALVGALEYRE